MRPVRSASLLVCFLLTLASAAAGASSSALDATGALPTASPAELGLSAERLQRIDAAMQAHVDSGHIAGAIGLVARRGKVAYVETWGHADREAKKPMTTDALFRMYSMTKAVTGVAVMMLHEEQGWPLSAPASRWIPELGDMKVVVHEADPETGSPRHRLVDAKRDITIRDLLTHTSGISYTGPRDAQGELYYQKAVAQRRGGQMTIGELAKALGNAPLHNHPGDVWQYGLSQDVLAALVEVMSDQTYDEFLRERIFEPLGMVDTQHWVDESKHDRLTTLYTPADAGITRSQAPAQDSYKSKPAMLGGGSGLVSTVGDYLRFCQMLLGGGELEGTRLLSRKSVELMASDHIGDLPRVGGLIGPKDGFGLTFRVVREPGLSGALGSPGEYSWGGAAGTRFWIDPEEELIGLFMVQILPHTGLEYGTQFKNLVYQSIVD